MGRIKGNFNEAETKIDRSSSILSWLGRWFYCFNCCRPENPAPVGGWCDAFSTFLVESYQWTSIQNLVFIVSDTVTLWIEYVWSMSINWYRCVAISQTGLRCEECLSYNVPKIWATGLLRWMCTLKGGLRHESCSNPRFQLFRPSPLIDWWFRGRYHASLIFGSNTYSPRKSLWSQDPKTQQKLTPRAVQLCSVMSQHCSARSSQQSSVRSWTEQSGFESLNVVKPDCSLFCSVKRFCFDAGTDNIIRARDWKPTVWSRCDSFLNV